MGTTQDKIINFLSENRNKLFFAREISERTNIRQKGLTNYLVRIRREPFNRIREGNAGIAIHNCVDPADKKRKLAYGWFDQDKWCMRCQSPINLCKHGRED